MTIDYKRMQAEWPKQKRALAKAQKIEQYGDRLTAIEQVCIDAVTLWDEVGAWPDDWSMFQRALNDAQHWQQQTSLEEFIADHRAKQRQERDAAAEAVRAAIADTQRIHDEQYPEHAKLKALDGQNDTVGQFIDWLSEREYTIAQYNAKSGRLYPVGMSPSQLIGAFFGIPPEALSEEKDRMIATLRGEAVKS